jgi:hypothetical protein
MWTTGFELFEGIFSLTNYTQPEYMAAMGCCPKLEAVGPFSSRMEKAIQTSNAVVLDLCLRLFPAPHVEATKWNAMFDQKDLLSNTGQGHVSCSPCSKGIDVIPALRAA